MSRVIHFEIHATGPEALIDYSTGLLGWSFAKQEARDYLLAYVKDRTATSSACCSPTRRPRSCPPRCQRDEVPI
jgi:predicted enzyme related to lactoylglutathione lyase